jgi:hypothetical protein
MSDIFAAMPDLTEPEALRLIAGLAIGLWLILAAGFSAVHISSARKR